MSMKKFITLIFAAIIGIGVAYARDRVTSNVNELPQVARTTLSTHFKNVKVNHIKIDEGIFGADDYDVVLENGTEIDFDGDGKLKEVEAGINGVPSSLILKPILNYITKNYAKCKIVGYEIKRNGYEVELNNGIEVKFDRNGSFKSEER